MFSRRWHTGTLMRAAVGVAAVAAMATVSPAAARAALQGGTAPGWPQLQGNAAHTGYEAAEKSVTRQNIGQLSVDWTASLDGTSTESEPVVADGIVYVNALGTLTAYNADSGTQRWQASMGGVGLQGTPSVQG
ncbi:MAG: PQQ-binding-like beta-propeller repeat protein, partial [Streptosporangiaceae bacterium]